MYLTSRLLSLALFALSYLLLVQVINYFSLRRLGRFPRARNYPFVSVLVPARNEERNIKECIESLLAQKYPHYEIIVLDDESTDGTWQILSRLAKGKNHLHLMKGTPPPPGWVGKCWACHQLSQKARGEYLLFVDADTVHEPVMLRSAIDAALFYQADLLSGIPHEKVETLSELLTVPLITWGMFAALPLPLAFALPWPGLSLTIGQLLLFKRDGYERIDGHNAVRDQVCEDMALGRLIKANGLRWRLVDAGEVTRCRMYTSLAEAVNGLSKSIFGALNYRVMLIFLFSLLLAVMFCFPPLLLLRATATVLPRFLVRRALIAVLLALASWGMANFRFRQPQAATFLYPLISALSIFIFFRSMFLTMRGKASWKGRILPVRGIN